MHEVALSMNYYKISCFRSGHESVLILNSKLRLKVTAPQKRWCSIENLPLSCTVSEIVMFSCKPELTSWCYYPLEALDRVFNIAVWKRDRDFLLVSYRIVSSIKHRFRDNGMFLLTETNFMVLDSQGGAVWHFEGRNLKRRPRFLISVP